MRFLVNSILRCLSNYWRYRINEPLRLRTRVKYQIPSHVQLGKRRINQWCMDVNDRRHIILKSDFVQNPLYQPKYIRSAIQNVH